MKQVILILILFLISCGKKDSQNSLLPKNTLFSTKLNDINCEDCAIVQYSDNIVLITMNSNFHDNDCLGSNQIELLNGQFALPLAGGRTDFQLDPEIGMQTCSIKSSSGMYIIENNNLYDMFIGNYKITLRKE